MTLSPDGLAELIRQTRADVIDLRLSGQTPKLHPHGFIQVDLSTDRSRRLHVWDYEIVRRADPETVHDHVWSFRSTVLCGRLVNRAYSAFWRDRGRYELWQARAERHPDARGGKFLEATGKYGDLVVVGREVCRVGESYTFSPFVFHDTDAYGPTATLFEKGEVYEGQPRVLCRLGHDPDACDLPVPDVEWMWEKVLAVLPE